MVGLKARQVSERGEGHAVFLERGFEGFEGGVAVDVWFAEAEEIEIWAVDQEDMFCHF